MHILDREEMPPPRPSSWRPLGSGEPRMERKMGGQAVRDGGREEVVKRMAREVPPRYFERERYVSWGWERWVGLGLT